MTFGERLQYALNMRNKKASDLSRATGLSQSLISQYLVINLKLRMIRLF